jgi:hypothetical protein
MATDKRRKMEVKMSSEETAAMVGSISSRILLHIWRGSVIARYPLRKMAITISSKEVIKAKRAPEITPGRIRGKVTLKKVIKRLAPKLMAAYSRV